MKRMSIGKTYGLALIEGLPVFFEYDTTRGSGKLDRSEPAYLPHSGDGTPPLRLWELPDLLARKAKCSTFPVVVTYAKVGDNDDEALRFPSGEFLTLAELARYEGLQVELA